MYFGTISTLKRNRNCTKKIINFQLFLNRRFGQNLVWVPHKKMLFGINQTPNCGAICESQIAPQCQTPSKTILTVATHVRSKKRRIFWQSRLKIYI